MYSKTIRFDPLFLCLFVLLTISKKINPMKFLYYLLVTLVLLVLTSSTFAQKLADPILLWPDGAPGATGTSDEDKPAIIPFVPAEAKRNGAAILVIPGGGFTIRATDHEGVLVSQWLKSQGITAFLLRYRLRPLYTRNEWLKDGQRAMQYIRAHAANIIFQPIAWAQSVFLPERSWRRICHLTRCPVKPRRKTRWIVSQRALIFRFWPMAQCRYPRHWIRRRLPNFHPPFCTARSKTQAVWAACWGLYTSLFSAKVPVEAHFFRSGEHGSGFAVGDPILGEWPKLMHTWLAAGGLLTDKPRYQLPGLVKLDGAPLLRGIVILTPVDNPAAPPVVAYITNAHTRALGSFIVPQNQGPVAGKYRVEVRQEATRWTSNSRDPFMLKITEKQRSNSLTDADRKEWGEYLRKRDLSPSIENQRVFRRQRPERQKRLHCRNQRRLVNSRLEVFSR